MQYVKLVMTQMLSVMLHFSKEGSYLLPGSANLGIGIICVGCHVCKELRLVYSYQLQK
jgi:hypothetical protein